MKCISSFGDSLPTVYFRLWEIPPNEVYLLIWRFPEYSEDPHKGKYTFPPLGEYTYNGESPHGETHR